MACTYTISSTDTGRRREQGSGRGEKRVVWDHKWTATCGASKSGYEVKGTCVSDAIAHCRDCKK